ncbi:MAG: hypothetical protein OEU92_15235 [Alphaproteobacteria bacterium]|nr:hypothetical protein [Alphaproteobacteria bacterium]
MKIKKLETFLADAGQRNFLFVQLTANTEPVGFGEATLEWQEWAIEILLNEWVACRLISKDPFDIEAVVGAMIRDQYQGSSTVMTVISAAEIAMWDNIVGKATGQPVSRPIGGHAKSELPAYINGCYGCCDTQDAFAARARNHPGRGRRRRVWRRAFDRDPWASGCQRCCAVHPKT